MPCHARIWWIRAVANISVPCALMIRAVPNMSALCHAQYQEAIVNPGTYRESRNVSRIQEPIVHPGCREPCCEPSTEIRDVFESLAPEYFSIRF